MDIVIKKEEVIEIIKKHLDEKFDGMEIKDVSFILTHSKQYHRKVEFEGIKFEVKE